MNLVYVPNLNVAVYAETTDKKSGFGIALTQWFVKRMNWHCEDCVEYFDSKAQRDAILKIYQGDKDITEIEILDPK
jgi:hypothetical protein